MSILSAISHYAAELREARARYQTERQISALPFEVQKDIGWRIDHPSQRTANPAWLKH